MSPVANTSRSLSPTTSTIAWKSSAAPTACWMPLISASSALRARVGRALLELERQLRWRARSRKLGGAAPGELGEAVAIGGGEAAWRPSMSA